MDEQDAGRRLMEHIPLLAMMVGSRAKVMWSIPAYWIMGSAALIILQAVVFTWRSAVLVTKVETTIAAQAKDLSDYKMQVAKEHAEIRAAQDSDISDLRASKLIREEAVNRIVKLETQMAVVMEYEHQQQFYVMQGRLNRLEQSPTRSKGKQ